MTSTLLFANVIFPAPIAIFVFGIFLWPIAIIALALEFFVIASVQAPEYARIRIFSNFLMANIASTIVGIGLALLPGIPTGYGAGGVDAMDNTTWWSIAVSSALFFCSLSILIEGLLYRYVPLFGGISRSWRSSLLGNLTSYGVLILLMTILFLA
jgi:hypothetical protein